MFERLFGWSKEPEAEPQIDVVTDPLKDLDDLIKKAIDEWTSRNHKDLDCWIDRKDNIDGSVWMIKLQPQKPLNVLATKKGL